MHVKKLLHTNALAVAFVICCNTGIAQSVAINDNGSAPNASAMLDINTYGGTKKGLLIPRLTTVAIGNIASPADGLMVYDTDLKQLKIFKAAFGWTVANFSLPYSGGATTVGPNTGVFEISYDGPLPAEFTSKYAAYFNGKNASGLYVSSNTSSAINAISSSGVGMYLAALNGRGLQVEATGGYGIYAKSYNFVGIYAESNTHNAIEGQTTKNTYAGVRGYNSTSGWGVIGSAGSSGIGVEGLVGNNGVGVKGTAGSNGIGVYGVTSGLLSYGVYANSDIGTALYGYTSSGIALYASANSSGYAGSFSGKVIMNSFTSNTITPNLDVREAALVNYTRINLSNANFSKAWTLAAIANNSTEELNFYLGYTTTGTGFNAMSIRGTGNLCLSGTLTCASDARLKKDITPLNNSLNDLLQLNGYTYYWKDEHKDTRQQIGLLAQEVNKVLPLLVSTDADGMMSVNYNGMVPVIINAMKELKEENEALKKRLEVLEKRM